MLAKFLFLLINLKLTVGLTWFGNFSNFASWPIKTSYFSENRQIVNDPKGGFDKVLKVKYPAGSYSTGSVKGGTQFYVYPLENVATGHVAFEFEVLFPADFDFVKGGKLPGLFGGKTGCGGGDLAMDCFSARFMWGPNGSGLAKIGSTFA